jgi:hypothetical protein
MTTPASGPCAWPVSQTSCVPAEADRTDDEQARYVRLLALGTETLWRASGRRYGLCVSTVRPDVPECCAGLSEAFSVPSHGWGPRLDAGVWSNSACGSGRHGITVALPGHVRGVTEVRVDGTALPTSAYRVDDHRLLVRQDGKSWPPQAWNLPAGSPGTWTVTYSHGLPVDELGSNALAAYVCELWKASTGQKCRLPARVEGIFRQGVNIDFSDDNLDLLSKGRTGIPEADQWLALVNPKGYSGPSWVYSPDLPSVRLTTTP